MRRLIPPLPPLLLPPLRIPPSKPAPPAPPPRTQHDGSQDGAMALLAMQLAAMRAQLDALAVTVAAPVTPQERGHFLRLQSTSPYTEEGGGYLYLDAWSSETSGYWVEPEDVEFRGISWRIESVPGEELEVTGDTEPKFELVVDGLVVAVCPLGSVTLPSHGGQPWLDALGGNIVAPQVPTGLPWGVRVAWGDTEGTCAVIRAVVNVVQL